MMISIIIPTLNEAKELPETLEALKTNKAHPHEIILACAGSIKPDEHLAEKYEAELINCPKPSRAEQMNQGARAARGHALLFLHADTHLSPKCLEAIYLTLQNPQIVGGCFTRSFRHPSRLLKLSCALSKIRPIFRGPMFGDQAMFVRAESFCAVGGFNPSDPSEDIGLSMRLQQIGKVILLEHRISTSARRFQKRGVPAQMAIDFFLGLQYYLRELLKRFRKPKTQKHSYTSRENEPEAQGLKNPEA